MTGTTAMVCFRTERGQFALPIAATLSVRTMAGLVELPSPGPDVLGMLPGDPPLSVLSTLGAGGDRVLVCVSDEVRYGLQVLEVLGVRHVDDGLIGPAPIGQGDGLVVGTISDGDDLVLIADAGAIGARR